MDKGFYMDDMTRKLLYDKLDKLDKISDRLTEHIAWEESYHVEQRNTLKRIEEQTVKTNGRVTALELWKSNAVGRVAGVSITLSILTTIAIYIMKGFGLL